MCPDDCWPVHFIPNVAEEIFAGFFFVVLTKNIPDRILCIHTIAVPVYLFCSRFDQFVFAC